MSLFWQDSSSSASTREMLFGGLRVIAAVPVGSETAVAPRCRGDPQLFQARSAATMAHSALR
jgi:hypothetical protein